MTKPAITIRSLEKYRRRKRRPPVTVAYGMGVDSTAMLILLWLAGIRPDLILFADTGGEKPETYAYLPIINAWLRKVGFPEVITVRKRSPITGDRRLEDECLRKGGLPSIAYGGHSCSDKWKKRPQDQYVNNWQPARTAWARGERVFKLIGYDADPRDTKRACRARTYVTSKGDKKYEYVFPLQELVITREDCMEIIALAGLPAPPKSSCYFCTAMKEPEIRELRQTNPRLYRRALKMEARAMPNLVQIKGLGRSRSWASLETKFKDEERIERYAKKKDTKTGRTIAARRLAA
jgi:3'-phosphoadenosine 5'-phosphosulfate sulfotransferase (PAPS reductase)/FAD synthetase